jgi:hypothetical protein
MRSKAYWAIASAAMLAACAGQDGQDPTTGAPESTSTTSSSLDESAATPGKTESVFVTVEAEFDRCEPLASCGLAWVREVGTPARRWLVLLDESGLGSGAVEQMNGAQGGGLVLRGVIGGQDGDDARIRTFAVLDAWRGMPDVEARPESAYVRVEMRDGQLVARLLDGERQHPIRSVSVAGAATPWVSTDWLESRVLSRNALVAGSFDGDTLAASQVFVHLPDSWGPCMALAIRCEPGTVPTYERDANRCLNPTGCAAPRMCPLFVPACDAGYTLVSWPSQPKACLAYACDPSFIDVH